QRLRVRAADMEQKQKDQRGLEEIVAECREKLGPEEGREAPRHQQGRGHGFSAGSNGRGARMRDKRWFGLPPLPAGEAPRREGWGEGLFASLPLTQLTSWQHHRALSPQAGRGHVPRRRPTGGADGLRDDNLGKRTIARRGRAKRRHWREANADRAQNQGGRPGAARRSGPATFDFATGAGAARRAPSEWLRRSDKRPPRMRA